MSFTDKPLACCDCHMLFVFSAGEQEFFADKKLVNEPKRCPNCRVLTRLKRCGSEQAATKVNCEDCGAVTLVPFKPTGSKPCYCSICFRTKQREQAQVAHLALLGA
jgi:CxxC-x17-CxxC domain-containing protein